MSDNGLQPWTTEECPPAGASFTAITTDGRPIEVVHFADYDRAQRRYRSMARLAGLALAVVCVLFIRKGVSENAS